MEQLIHLYPTPLRSAETLKSLNVSLTWDPWSDVIRRADIYTDWTKSDYISKAIQLTVAVPTWDKLARRRCVHEICAATLHGRPSKTNQPSAMAGTG